MSEQLIRELVGALEQADLYLNSYDTSAPSRVKATTRASVEAALGLAKSSLPPEVLANTTIDPNSPALRRILGRAQRAHKPHMSHPTWMCSECTEAEYR